MATANGFIHSFYQSTTLLILTVNLQRKVFDVRDFAYRGMSVVDNLYLQRSLVASLPYGSHLCCGGGAWCSKLPWLRSMEIAHMEGGVRNMQFRLCVSLCMLTRLRWIIIVSYCFARTECCNATRNLVSLFHCRDYHIIFNRGRQLHEEDDSHTLVVALRRLKRVSIHPSRRIFVRCYSARNSGQCYCRRFFVRFWHFWTYEIKSIAQIRCR